MRRFVSPILFLVTGALLGNCSQQGPATTAPGAASESAPKPTNPFPYGAKVDSLNGLAGHTFGQPLRAFPKMELLPSDPGQLVRCYTRPAGPPTGWFGKHRREVPSQFYYFLDGQFCHFRAVGDAATLRAEVEFLLGPGLVDYPNTFWEGSRARAVYSEQARGFGREGTLDVLSKPLEAALKAQQKAKLQADNAQ